MRLDSHSQVIKISERIRKVMFEKYGRRHSVLDTTSFPSILEKDVEQFMKHHSLNHTELENSEDANSHNDSMYSPKKCYLVKEVNSDIEDDDSE